MTGNAYIPDLNNPAKLGVSFSGSVFNSGSGSGNSTNYNVIDTDYTTYSLVYSCSLSFFGIVKTEVAWILSRSRTLDQTIINNLLAKVKQISPSLVSSLKMTDQSNCP